MTHAATNDAVACDWTALMLRTPTFNLSSSLCSNDRELACEPELEAPEIKMNTCIHACASTHIMYVYNHISLR